MSEEEGVVRAEAEAVPDTKAKKKKKTKNKFTLFNLPEIHFGIQWQFDGAQDASDAEPAKEEGPLKHSIGLTIPRVKYEIPLPDMLPGANEMLRHDFPAFSRYGDTQFLDNAGGTQMPALAIEAMREAMITSMCHPQSGHALSNNAARSARRVHEFERMFVNATSQGTVILGANVTDLIWRLGQLCGYTWNGEGNVIVSESANESNRTPWTRLKLQGIEVTNWGYSVEANDPCPIDKLEQLVNGSTRGVVLSHVNGITGQIADVKRIVDAVKSKAPQAFVVVEGSQYVGHRHVDVSEWGVDFYVYSAAKCFGPHLAMMYARHDALKLLSGPNHDFVGAEDLPRKFELGLPNAEACAGRFAFHDYLLRVCEIGSIVPNKASTKSTSPLALGSDTLAQIWSFLHPFETRLVGHLVGYLSSVEGVTVYGCHQPIPVDSDGEYEEPEEEEPGDESRPIGIISFTHKSISNSVIWEGLTKAKVAASAGHQGCPAMCDAMGLKTGDGDHDSGVVRLSLCHYTVASEVQRTIEALKVVFGDKK